MTFLVENISFLAHLTNWKKAWAKLNQIRRRDSATSNEVINEKVNVEDRLREQYHGAIIPYAIFISNDHAEFPLNLPSRTRHHLDDIFSRPTNILFGDTSSNTSTINFATPFDFDTLERNRSKSVAMTDIQESRLGSQSTGVLCLDDVWYWGSIPTDFTNQCFDEAEQEIKYLVLTNTWPKFVDGGCAEQIQDENGMSLGKSLSQHVYWDQHR